MPAQPSPDLPISEQQLGKAITALLNYASKRREQSNDLLEEDEFLYLVRCRGDAERRGDVAAARGGARRPACTGQRRQFERWCSSAGAKWQHCRQAAPWRWAAHCLTIATRRTPQVIALKNMPKAGRKDKPIRL